MKASSVVVVIAAKTLLYFATIVPLQSHLSELFCIVKNILLSGPVETSVDDLITHCDQCCLHFADKIAQIHSDSDATVDKEQWIDVTLASTCPFIVDTSQLVGPEDVNR